MTKALTGDTNDTTATGYSIKYTAASGNTKATWVATVNLTQTQDGWQTSDVSTIGGVTPTNSPKAKKTITITLTDGNNTPTIVCDQA